MGIEQIASGNSSSELMTVKEASDFLRLRVSTIRAWVLHRQIPFVKLGGKRVFFRRADLEALIEKSLVPSTTQSGNQKKAA